METGKRGWGGKKKRVEKKKKGKKPQGGMKIWKKPENTAIFQRNLYIDLIKLTIFCGSSSRYLKQAAKLESPQPQPPKSLVKQRSWVFPDHIFQKFRCFLLLLSFILRCSWWWFERPLICSCVSSLWTRTGHRGYGLTAKQKMVGVGAQTRYP